MERVTSSIDKELKDRCKLLAAKRGVSLSEVIRYGLECYMEMDGMGELEDYYQMKLPTKRLPKPREVKDNGGLSKHKHKLKLPCGEGKYEERKSHPCGGAHGGDRKRTLGIN